MLKYIEHLSLSVYYRIKIIKILQLILIRMFQAKEWVLDRIEQTFSILIQNPIALISPIAIFQIIMIVILPQIGMGLILWWNFMETSSVSSLLYITMSLAITYGLFYVILIIPVTLWVMKWASDLIEWKDITVQDMLGYGFQKLSDSFKVYWYMFAYAYLVPALCFIVAGSIMLYGLYFNNEGISSLAWWLMVVSVIYAAIQWIYRWLKSSFAIWSAVYEEDFSQEQFNTSVSYTKWKWWRIFWNFFLIWMITALLMGLVSGLIWSISFMWTVHSGIDINSLLGQADTDIQTSIENFIGDRSGINIFKIITDSISQVLGSVVSAFMLLFTIIFYIRLKQETNQQKTPIQESYISTEL